MKACAFIFARGGSKGVPRKNIKPLNGKPLIAYAIETALTCPSLGAVYVSTDDDEIAQVASDFGAQVPFRRPAEMATDTASEWLAWRHAIEWVEQNREPFDLFVSLPTTSPFRSVQDVEACLNMLRTDPLADIVTTVKKADRSPYFNMVALDAEGVAQPVIRPKTKVVRRQDVPTVFDMTTVAYAARPTFIKNHDGIFDGRMRIVEVPAERALDIDTPFDFMIAEYIARSLTSERT